MGEQHRSEPPAVVDCGTDRADAGPDRLIARIATKQHGVVARAQLLAAGLTRGAIDHRLETGRLRALRRGVYLVGAVAPPRAPEMAAVLACGPGAVISHTSVTHLSALLPYKPDTIHVTVPGRGPGQKPGLTIHRVLRLDHRDVTTFDRIPVTTPARTVVDLASVLAPNALERLLAEVFLRRLATRRDLQGVLERAGRRRGIAAVRRLLEDREPAYTRSEAERRFLALIQSAGLPRPEVNARVGPFEVDFVWRAERLIVEVDGFRYHASRAAFERDRARDAKLQAHGWLIMRVTWRQLSERATAVAAQVAGALARRVA
jgi:very-short-patch-repair endonuclease